MQIQYQEMLLIVQILILIQQSAQKFQTVTLQLLLLSQPQKDTQILQPQMHKMQLKAIQILQFHLKFPVQMEHMMQQDLQQMHKPQQLAIQILQLLQLQHQSKAMLMLQLQMLKMQQNLMQTLFLAQLSQMLQHIQIQKLLVLFQQLHQH